MAPSGDLSAAQRALDAARDRQRRAMMGLPLVLSDGTLDALAEIGERDMPSAEVLWRAANPGQLGGLLDAAPEE